MLRLPNQLADPKANEIVKAFVNERLINLMEEIILDEVAWKMALSGELTEEAATKPFDEMVNIAELMNDMDFAQNVSLMYLPDNYPADRANQEFFGLYNLLKAEKEYVPDLVKEYILFAIIYMEVEETDMINDDMADGLYDELDDLDEIDKPEELKYLGEDDLEELDGDIPFLGDMSEDDFADIPFFDDMDDEDMEYTTVEQIPEPERTIVKEAIRKQYEGSVEPEELEDLLDYALSTYEDLREYEDSCFWDHDFMMLDDMTMEEILNSDLNKVLGIADPKPSKVIEFPFKNADGQEKSIKAKIIVHPWDEEDK